MLLIHCTVELKLKLTKYCVLSGTGADNVNGNFNDNISNNSNITSNNIVFPIRDPKWYVTCCNFISKRQSKTIKTS